MKKIEITLKGVNEEKIAQAIMDSIYASIRKKGYCDVSIHTETEKEAEPEKERSYDPLPGMVPLTIPTFMQSNRSKSTAGSRYARRG